MKVPPTPPEAEKVLMEAARRDRKKIVLMLERPGIVDHRGDYLHWEKLRFKKPRVDLSPEEVWASTRLARRAASQSLDLVEKTGNPFTFCEPPSLKAALRELDMNAGGALASDATALSQGEGRIHLARSLAEEPFASSFIEGAATTRQIAKKLIFENRAPRTKDERMVLNNYQAMQFVKLHKDEPLTLPMLLELHRIVTDQTLDDPNDAGRIRASDDVQVVDETNYEVLWQPPPAADLADRLRKVLTFANEKPDASRWVHPLVVAFILHFMLSYEHPFVDGNGRVARALFYWAALKAGYWLVEYVSISSVIAEAKIAYGRAFLHTETDSGDLTYFLIYHSKILQRAVDRLNQFVERKRKEVMAFERRLGDKNRPDAFNHRQSWLLNEFARGRLRRITISEHQHRHGVSYLTARSDLEALAESKYLQKRKVGQMSVYLAVPDLIKLLTAI
ncbi:MAG: Fic family protein [Alphaproteobacteria bacterium]|nr:Fic family protein [Alphaproteobacteria bacterium]